MPKGYKPTYKRAVFGLGNGVDIDIKAMEANQQLHAYTVLQQHTKIISFEPHLHAPGTRMCLEAIWGYNIQTLNCVGYDHNWVRGYDYTDDSAPLLPNGTILHIIGYMDNSPTNKNVPDPRNWQGSGNRSVANMFIDLGMRVALNDEQFQEEMAKRREQLHLTKNDNVIGCPLCLVMPPAPAMRPTGSQQQQRRAGHGTRVEHANLDRSLRSPVESARGRLVSLCSGFSACSCCVVAAGVARAVALLHEGPERRARLRRLGTGR